MKRFHSTLGLVAALVVGCASASVPPARVASSEAAVKKARDAGAERDPKAKQQLALAENELGEAKKIIETKGDADHAEALLTRSMSDAALAASLSREADQRARAASAVPFF